MTPHVEGEARMTTSTTPVDAGLFRQHDGEPRLIAGRCHECGAVAFPRPQSCARCTSEQIDDHLLARTGTLWSWTVQRFEPKEPFVGAQPFEPYGVGYVDLDGEVLVESRLTTADPEQLEIGRPVELVVVPFATRRDDNVATFAFRPTRGSVAP
jgi:uncharacterized OB-fold protein